MQVEVYETEADALDAAGALACAWLSETQAERRALALPGGRGGRAVMTALAAREAMPWRQLAVCVTDEPCVPFGDARSNRRLLRENLLGPRRIEVPGPGVVDEDPAAAYWREVREVAGDATAFDLLVLALDPRGALGALVPDSPALALHDAAVVRVEPPWTPADGDVAWTGLGPAALGRARRAIVTAFGAERAAALARALREPERAGSPASLLLPSARVTWFADRAAAAELLRDARPA